MDAIAIGGIWRFLTWLPKFVLRRIFTADRLSELVLFDVRPRHEYATVNLGDVASYEIWFQLTNISPFDVELDRAAIRFWCGGTIQNASILERTLVPSGQITTVRVSEAIVDGHANQIAKHVENHNSAIEGVLEFNSTVHPFSKKDWHLNGVLPRFVNTEYRIRDEANRSVPDALD